MVFVNDFVREFYDRLLQRRILILVNLDVDAICACKILQNLLECDQTSHTVVSVGGLVDLDSAFAQHSKGVDHVICINCGGGIDLFERLQPAEHVLFFVLDSHRPVNVFNIYNASQIQLVINRGDIDNIPPYETIFREDEGSGSESDSGSDDEVGKRPRFDVDYLEKKRERRLHADKRDKALFDYSKYTWNGTSVALTIFEIAWKLGRDTNDLLWLAIAGVTSQYVHRKVDYENYFDKIQPLQQHVARLKQTANDSLSISCLRIELHQELCLDLYRHWSLFESLCHSTSIACHYKVWNVDGKKRLQRFLTTLGLSPAQYHQKFEAMDQKLREDLHQTIEDHVQEEGLETRDVFIPSFQAKFGYLDAPSAIDFVHSCSALLEEVDSGKSVSDKFLSALDVLKRSNTPLYRRGISLARDQLKAIKTQVDTFIKTSKIVPTGRYLQAEVQEGTKEAPYFGSPVCLSRLAHFTLEAFNASTKSRKFKALPLIIWAPLEHKKGYSLVAGIPPLEIIKKRNGRNILGAAFGQVSNRVTVVLDSFDNPVIELKTEDMTKFFDILVDVLDPQDPRSLL